MPRYFFHTVDGGRVPDDKGTELAGINAARKEAIRYAGAVLNEQPDILWDGSEFRVEVTDNDGNWVLTVVTLALSAPPPAGVSDGRDQHKSHRPPFPADQPR